MAGCATRLVRCAAAGSQLGSGQPVLEAWSTREAKVVVGPLLWTCAGRCWLLPAGLLPAGPGAPAAAREGSPAAMVPSAASVLHHLLLPAAPASGAACCMLVPVPLVHAAAGLSASCCCTACRRAWRRCQMGSGDGLSSITIIGAAAAGEAPLAAAAGEVGAAPASCSDMPTAALASRPSLVRPLPGGGDTAAADAAGALALPLARPRCCLGLAAGCCCSCCCGCSCRCCLSCWCWCSHASSCCLTTCCSSADSSSLPEPCSNCCSSCRTMASCCASSSSGPGACCTLQCIVPICHPFASASSAHNIKRSCADSYRQVLIVQHGLSTCASELYMSMGFAACMGQCSRHVLSSFSWQPAAMAYRLVARGLRLAAGLAAAACSALAAAAAAPAAAAAFGLRLLGCFLGLVAASAVSAAVPSVPASSAEAAPLFAVPLAFLHTNHIMVRGSTAQAGAQLHAAPRATS